MAPHANALFDESSASWRLRQTGGIVMSMAKARAALLQLAHPKIAAGLAAHSTFEQDPFRRVQITGQTMSAIAFGSPDEAAEAQRLLGRMHAKVRGEAASGEIYSASDPELLWFVLATLIASDLLVEQTYVRAFTDADRDAYYAEWLLVSDSFHIPRSLVPPDRAGLATYMNAASAALAIGDYARRVAQRILAPTFIRAPRPALWGYKQLLADLLPTGVRTGYGLPARPPMHARLLTATARATLPRVPPRFRRARIEPTR